MATELGLPERWIFIDQLHHGCHHVCISTADESPPHTPASASAPAPTTPGCKSSATVLQVVKR